MADTAGYLSQAAPRLCSKKSESVILRDSDESGGLTLTTTSVVARGGEDPAGGCWQGLTVHDGMESCWENVCDLYAVHLDRCSPF